MANNTDGNDAAFARPSDGVYLMANGLTKREYFAAQFMAALLTYKGYGAYDPVECYDDAIKLATV